VARTGVPKLTQLFGPLGSTDLTIKEHPSATGSDVYVASSATLRLAETTATEEAVLHRVARLWFDEDLFGAGWLRDAYADWAEVASGAGTPPCTEPPTYPGVGEPNLAASHDIGPGATERERSTHTWERQAGCFLVASIADEIGMERMQATIATLRGNGSGFGEAVDATPRHLARDWHSWLDVIEQEGLRPAGAAPDLAARLLRSYGVTFDDAALAKHAQAVEAYLALQKLTGGVVPAPITSALAGWQFDEASAATSAATAAWQAGDAAVATVAGSSADGGPVRAAVLAATTQDELDSAVALAARQQVLATDVSAALATAAEPRDAIQQLGLLGTILPANADAVTAVTKLDVDGGTAVAQQIRTVIGAARDIGIQRAAAIGGLLVAVLILLLGAFLLRRRRRRRRASAVTPPVDLAGPPAQA
jgi:hypothetical protein